MSRQGKVWLVGAGPGDVGLFTIKGKDILAKAEVVVYDSLVGDGVLTMVPETAEKINVGKRAGHHTMKQENINKVLLEKAQEGKRVVRLKGGDPFLFGRGGEELELLCEHKILLLALAEEMPEEGKADWMEERLLAGMEGWVKEQTEQKYRDESMVEKVRKLEAAIRELSDDEEQKFSVEELAAYLDMDEEEIRAVLRLTSEGADEEK